MQVGQGTVSLNMINGEGKSTSSAIKGSSFVTTGPATGGIGMNSLKKDQETTYGKVSKGLGDTAANYESRLLSKYLNPPSLPSTANYKHLRQAARLQDGRGPYLASNVAGARQHQQPQRGVGHSQSASKDAEEPSVGSMQRRKKQQGIISN